MLHIIVIIESCIIGWLVGRTLFAIPVATFIIDKKDEDEYIVRLDLGESLETISKKKRFIVEVDTTTELESMKDHE